MVGGESPQGMVSGPELSRENRIEHLVKLSEGLLLMELPEGLIGDGILQIWAGNRQPVGGDPAPGDQPMLSAATAHHQIGLKECGHVRSARRSEAASVSPLNPSCPQISADVKRSDSNRQYI